jgi:hypothetical protein
VSEEGATDGKVIVPPRDGAATIRVAYLFSGKSRRASIAEELRKLCLKSGMGLCFEQIDIYVGGTSHDLLDSECQAALEARIAGGEFDFIILSPPCGSWSRCNYSRKPGAKPCRSKEFPWGFPNAGPGQKARAEQGNEFIHFCIRAVEAAAAARKRHNATVRVLWEHPEDLGVTPKGTPASVWQLSEVRRFTTDEFGYFTVVGHQCQFGVDYAKPTRLLCDIPGVEAFGHAGWPRFHASGHYAGPLPRCGHVHKEPTHGQNEQGTGFHSSPKAAYPPKMCVFFANCIFEDAWNRLARPKVGEKRQTGHTTAPASSPRRVTGDVSSSSRARGPTEVPGAGSIARKAEVEADFEASVSDRPVMEGIDHLLPKGATEAELDTSDEERERPGWRRLPYGSGWWGRGSPLMANKKGGKVPIVDGGGLCSPGRWPIKQRVLPDGKAVAMVREIIWEGFLRCTPKFDRGCPKRELMRIACGHRESSPFPAKEVERIRKEVRAALKACGFGGGEPRHGDREQAFHVRLMGELASAAQDPDAYYTDFWARGVWVGSKDRPLPRTPAVFSRKVKWRLGELDPLAQPEWRPNYSSLDDHVPQVKKQFEQEEERGFMGRTSLRQALSRYGDSLSVGAIGAIEKKGETEEVRIIFDATHGVLTNFLIRVRDHVRNPTSADIRAVLCEMAREACGHFTLVYDVSHAHRQIPVDEAEWGRLACQIEGTAADTLREQSPLLRGRSSAAVRPSQITFTEAQLNEEIWLNKVGTFGVGSAGYWWGRAGALLVRLSHYYAPRQLRPLWILLYADDGKVTAGGRQFEVPLLVHLLFLEVLGTPMKWKKVKGGVQVEWVGYLLDYGRFEMGVTESRALWCSKWLRDKVRERCAGLGELRECLGRLVFVAGPIEHIRPMLGPLFAWSSTGPRRMRPRLPPMLLILMGFLASQLESSHMTGCREDAKDKGELFRLDAKAEGQEVAIGGWLCAEGCSTKDAPWFAVKLTRQNAAWAFARGEPFRTIASLELLGALVGVMVLLPDRLFDRGLESTGLVTFGCATDNQGNSFLVDRLMTTKYPLGIILVELCHQLAIRRAALRARWVPRLENEEADALTNSDFRHFTPSKRIEVDLAKLPFGVLPKLLENGEDYIKELEALRLEKAKAHDCVAKRRRIKGESLRDTQPWQ